MTTFRGQDGRSFPWEVAKTESRASYYDENQCIQKRYASFSILDSLDDFEDSYMSNIGAPGISNSCIHPDLSMNSKSLTCDAWNQDTQSTVASSIASAGTRASLDSFPRPVDYAHFVSDLGYPGHEAQRGTNNPSIVLCLSSLLK